MAYLESYYIIYTPHVLKEEYISMPGKLLHIVNSLKYAFLEMKLSPRGVVHPHETLPSSTLIICTFSCFYLREHNDPEYCICAVRHDVQCVPSEFFTRSWIRHQLPWLVGCFKHMQ